MIDCRKRDHPLSPFQPHTQATMLRQIARVLKYADTDWLSMSPLEPAVELDAPQFALLRWGMVVPWCWVVWHNERMAGQEVVECLVRRSYIALHFVSCISSIADGDIIRAFRKVLAK